MKTGGTDRHVLPASCLTYLPTNNNSRKINYTRTTITVGKQLLNDKNPSRESRNVVILKSIKVLGLSSQAGFPLRKMFLRQESFHCIKIISSVQELTRHRKLSCSRKMFLQWKPNLRRCRLLRTEMTCLVKKNSVESKIVRLFVIPVHRTIFA